ncbi:dosage compensation regulator isoform 1 [Tropilaelaps mercedesae]|uniref:RNA helicase n=1 Tax=Tropilaelaps mercedesae TaxID=418985 RepID=A0A1V9X5W7_9ACAR|nr:dosage compensation regulator isoform 1 [Tropilaelaps mercedesae]
MGINSCFALVSIGLDSLIAALGPIKNGSQPPNYVVNPTGPKHRQRFLCEVRVEGLEYTGVGNSTNKKDAQTNAAKDFLQFLVREGRLQPSDVPREFPIGGGGTPAGGGPLFGPRWNAPREAPQQHASPYRGGMGEAYAERMLQQNRQNLEDAEDLDVNAEIHGNWTIENAKSKLHQYIQMNRIMADYNYRNIGPPHNMSFIAELTIYIRKLNRNLTAREHGSNKQTASKSCALSMVRQLFHLGEIEAFSGTLKKKEITAMKEFQLKLAPDVFDEVNHVVEKLGLKPNGPIKPPIPDNKFVIKEKRRAEVPQCSGQPDGVVGWSPPMANWNPWLQQNLDEHRFATMTLEQISKEMLELYNNQLDNPALRQMIQKREQLPVHQAYDALLDAIHANSVTIVRGNTGCGKTTQVPQYILDSFVNVDDGAQCNIVVTQPRRISAISVAERIAEERCEPLGESVGYSVRFESLLPRPYASILFCTVGVLLRKLEGGLRGISHVIIDEIHERDINTDFLMVVIRDMVKKHPQLRVILMSATIDITLFQEYFGNNVPVVEVQGRAFPVHQLFLEDTIDLLKWQPPIDARKKRKGKSGGGGDDDDDDLPGDELDENLNQVADSSFGPEVASTMAALDERQISFELIADILRYCKQQQADSAVLVFLPGWNMIFALLKHLEADPQFGRKEDFSILPLHSQIPKEDQGRVFRPVPSGCMKVILSTNIAETSITINDVAFVIDTCKVKMKMFTAHNNMTNYATVFASKTNLEQRKGRAGRVQEGMCFHLISRERYKRLDQYSTPEIFRTPLHELALSIKLLKLGDITPFLNKAMEQPPIDAVVEAEVTLRNMGALNADSQLTKLGEILARMPIEPQLGRMIVMSVICHCADPLLTISANSSTFPEPFETPFIGRLQYLHRKFSGGQYSDHVTLLNVYQQWEQARLRGGEQQEQAFCDQWSVSLPTMRVTHDAKQQLRQILINAGFPEEEFERPMYNFKGEDKMLEVAVGLLIAGHYPNICYHQEKRKVRTRAVSCKQMTMVTPLQILLFGAQEVVATNIDTVVVDNWIAFKMDPTLAAAIVSLQEPLNNLLHRVVEDPELLSQLPEADVALVNVVQRLCHFSSSGLDTPVGGVGFLAQNDVGEGPPVKRARHTSTNIGRSGFGHSGGAREPDGYGSMYGNNHMGGGFQSVKFKRGFRGRSFQDYAGKNGGFQGSSGFTTRSNIGGFRDNSGGGFIGGCHVGGSTGGNPGSYSFGRLRADSMYGFPPSGKN